MSDHDGVEQVFTMVWRAHPGIPADRTESVFDRFAQVQENDSRGLGLGLFISKAIVEGHGGRIWVESTLGHSTAVLFTIPTHPV